MKVPLSWLREFVDVPADPAVVAARLAACGFEVAGIEGDVIDFEITANRPDCLSVYGLAREAAAAFDRPLAPLDATLPARPAEDAARVPVTIESAACGRYVLAGATVTVTPSPGWLADRLAAAGVRPINSVVDATNYVMLEMGHPMHAFDASRLAGPELHVRLARPGERLTTLDGQTRSLDERMLVIADRDRAVAVAGVMGGAASEVSDATRRIAIESAWFEPASVRATSRRLGLQSEASARFERGADPNGPAAAVARALALLVRLDAGVSIGDVVDVWPRPATPRTVRLTRAALDRLLGAAVPDADVGRILTRLGFGISPAAEGWRVEVPTFRVDVSREADLIEEVGRHWGFDRVTPRFPALRTAPRPSAPTVALARRIRRLLAGAGLQEAATFSFLEHAAAEPFVADAATLAPIANPLSEKFAVLRPSLLPGLLDAVAYNTRRGTRDVRLFEIGSVFSAGGERLQIGWLVTGAWGAHWSGSGHPADAFDATGVAHLIAAALDLTLEIRPSGDLPGLVAGRCARLLATNDGRTAPFGVVGQIDPRAAAARGVPAADEVFGGVLDLVLDEALVEAAGRARPIAPLPRHPSIVRDLSIVVDERLPADSVRGTIRANAPSTLADVREFDRYQGKGVASGRVSLSMRLTFRDPDRTLTDSEVRQAVDAIVAALAREHGATLRGLP